jgi:REP element-mobilizing transposase RayT
MLAARYPVHVTLRMAPHVFQLRSRRCFREFEKAARAWHDRHADARIVQYAVQGNHIHLVVEASDQRVLGRCMQGFGIRLAKGLNRVMKCRGAVFSDRYHARIVRTPLETRRILLYLFRNARRHGLRPPSGALDPYSSAPLFDGFSRPVRVGWLPLSPGPPPCAPPATWLLREGWRRHGLLDPRELLS